MVKIELTSDELATIIELLVDEIIIMRDMNELDGEDVDRTTEELDVACARDIREEDSE